jgi:hypothetical protein
MIRLQLKILVTAMLCATCTAARAGDLYLICNSVVSLTAADVHDMFLGEKQFAGALRLVPVDNIAAQAAFLDKLLKMNAAKYSTTWTKKSFRDGVNPPLVAGGDVEALSYVRRTPGACSYVTTPVSPDVVVVSHL